MLVASDLLNIPRGSKQRDSFYLLIMQSADGIVAEYKFHPKRKWRFDLAVPSKKIAFEYEGVFSRKSRHVTVTGYSRDCEKYNEAALLGWQVYRFTALNFTGNRLAKTAGFLQRVLQ